MSMSFLESGRNDHGNNHPRKFTAPIAIPTPNTIPASIRFDSPSPNANMSPPTTIATRLRPRAIGPVKAVCKTATAFSHGDMTVSPFVEKRQRVAFTRDRTEQLYELGVR